MIRVIVVDDDPLVTQSLKTILEITGEIQVITTGSSAEEAVVAYQANQPDVLLMDIRMGASTGLVAAAEILAKYPAAKILLLTTFSDDEYIQEALRLGVKGYLIKQKLETIVPAIKAVTNGQSVFGTEIVERLTDLLQPSDTRAEQAVYEGLTPREQEVLVQIANGKKQPRNCRGPLFKRRYRPQLHQSIVGKTRITRSDTTGDFLLSTTRMTCSE